MAIAILKWRHIARVSRFYPFFSLDVPSVSNMFPHFSRANPPPTALATRSRGGLRPGLRRCYRDGRSHGAAALRASGGGAGGRSAGATAEGGRDARDARDGGGMAVPYFEAQLR